MNARKLLALPGLMAGAPARGCFALLGCSAAACAPAKYGMATELVPACQLVLADAWTRGVGGLRGAAGRGAGRLAGQPDGATRGRAWRGLVAGLAIWRERGLPVVAVGLRA